MDFKNKSEKSLIWYHVAKRIALVAGIFAVIVSILMIANYIQTKSIDPLNSKALNHLMLELQKDPENVALKEQIRALDLLARKAYFTNQWQIRSGGFLLFASLLILIVSLKYINSFKSRLPDLEQELDSDASWQSKILARKYVTYSGLSLIVIALASGLLWESELQVSESGSIDQIKYPTLEEIRQNWPAFRGPESNAIVYQSGFPTQWNGVTGENIIWKTAIPISGFNSPIIWDDKLFISGADQNTQVVYCINTQTGKILWQTELNNIPGSPDKPPKVTKDTGYAAPTMTTNGTYVYAIFGTGDIACLDYDGNRIWVKNLGVPKNHYGHSSSLIIHKNLLLVQFDHNSSKRLIALQAETGNEAYNIKRNVQISWASPILIHSADRTEIILNSNPFVISYNPENGQELWRIKCMDGEVAPSPAYSDGMVFVVNDYARLAAIKLGSPPEISWEYDDDLSEVPSPVATSELLIMPSSYGTVTCFDSKSGEIYWVHEFDEGFYSSPIMVDDLIFLMDKSGVMQIFKAAKEFQIVSQAPLGERVMTIPAFINMRIYIRAEKNLYCIGKQDG
jgi:outer membrane protein assembly factor BamB